MVQKKLSDFTDQLTALEASDRLLVARPANATDYYCSPQAIAALANWRVISVNPITNTIPPAFAGEILVQRRSSQCHTIWRHSSITATWEPVSGTPILGSSSASPDNSVVADYRGQIYLAIVNGSYGSITAAAYVASNTGSNRWAIL